LTGISLSAFIGATDAKAVPAYTAKRAH